MMRYISIFVTMLICVSVYGVVPKLFVYRNDNKFNQVELDASVILRHDISVLNKTLNIAEGVDIPLEAVDSLVVRKIDIPTVRITLIDYPEATMLWEKELYLNATVEIEGNGFIDDVPETILKIKGRGNTTWGMPKKPMRLKFDKKIQIGNLTKAKNYVLLNNYIDPSLMKNAVVMWLSEQLDMPYSNHGLPCNVYMNGHYAGSYLMTEKVGINSGSVDIDEATGMLFELSVEYDEPYKFRSESLGLPVMVKDPDFDELYENDPTGLTPSERLSLWQADFNRAESLAINKRGIEAFDIESFANYYLVNAVACNSEIGYPKSVYLYKRSLDATEKYYFGPTWDFDVSFNYYRLENDSIVEYPADKNLWTAHIFSRLLANEEFKNAYQQKFKEFKENIYPEMLDYVDWLAYQIDPSAKMNAQVWGEDVNLGWIYAYPSYDTKMLVGNLKEWIKKRVEYLESRVNAGLY